MNSVESITCDQFAILRKLRKLPPVAKKGMTSGELGIHAPITHHLIKKGFIKKGRGLDRTTYLITKKGRDFYNSSIAN
jgi:predicted transcriptional regulator